MNNHDTQQLVQDVQQTVQENCRLSESWYDMNEVPQAEVLNFQKLLSKSVPQLKKLGNLIAPNLANQGDSHWPIWQQAHNIIQELETSRMAEIELINASQQPFKEWTRALSIKETAALKQITQLQSLLHEIQ
ncbi:hypothetical protein D2Q93_00755 [Alicyclobacillaceae bacterium I2511]|nr:hypothetical protein D2Q93_00755 [Alicyclobacillaceae bacterium I2511]